MMTLYNQKKPHQKNPQEITIYIFNCD